ncbi:hypothetical protein BDN70DRAFT_870761 [Pholiota conissans]|uniref:BTB domain-containing protein n=1 Tax=Pholiota conissans TaxID=109636 RepID=A0A9P5ZDT5_9AGAR|nr:hypothetical protein BDN70DRAFT_870761 [Pholiota conissans]
MEKRMSINNHEYLPQGEPWFEDGNIVLITQENPTAFRIHRGVLSRHSEIFSDMLALPQPVTNTEFYMNCQVVTIYDLPSELSNLIKALYDGPHFANRSIEDFFYLAGILRLATKYFIEQLRRQAIHFLEQTWPCTLNAHDNMVETALSTPSVNNLSYPFAHPLHVLNLVREVDAKMLIPSTLYFLSLYPLSDILKADHPKLLVEHPSRPSSTLLSSDLLLYSLMYQHRLQVMDNFVRQFCTERAFKPACDGATPTCSKSFSRLVAQLHRSWTLRTGPLHYIYQAMQKVAADQSICGLCRASFHQGCSLLRQQVWDELPGVVNLPPWEEMHKI